MPHARQLASLSDAIWEVQNRTRHAGPRLGNRSIGSTLLVKGLEFDRAIVLRGGLQIADRANGDTTARGHTLDVPKMSRRLPRARYR